MQLVYNISITVCVVFDFRTTSCSSLHFNPPDNITPVDIILNYINLSMIVCNIITSLLWAPFRKNIILSLRQYLYNGRDVYHEYIQLF